jgi:uncharacterized iron-regulated protein
LLLIHDQNTRHGPDTIVRSDGQRVDRAMLLADLASVRIVYIGETHTNPVHHQVQLELIRDLQQHRADLMVGMEMFDKTYQPVLDQWSAGLLDEKAFLEKTHWYANWRFDFALYQDIVRHIGAQKVPLIGLNLPSYLPARIAVGGVDSLSPSDRALLPELINTGDAAHRAVLEPMLSSHRHLKGRDNLDYLYQAQCAWDDGMADVISRSIGQRSMVVLIGNGHIAHKHGVPNRAFSRNGIAFRTIYLVEAGNAVFSDVADYIWVTR